MHDWNVNRTVSDCEIGKFPLTFTEAQHRDVLSTAEYRQVGREIEVLVEGEWWLLCRTDLKDDICTGRPGRSFEEWLLAEALGARLKRYPDGRRVYAVVDAWSDG